MPTAGGGTSWRTSTRKHSMKTCFLLSVELLCATKRLSSCDEVEPVLGPGEGGEG
nr:MAG TPA: hypothetical protein [Caudoviricetes sp.]